MEDHNKSNAQRKERTEKTILDLTPEMELTGQDDNDIIDLTKALDSPPPLAAAPNLPNIEDGDAIPQPQSLTPASEAGSTEATEEVHDGSTPTEITEPHLHESAGQLFDQLSGITQQVDSAIEESPEGDAAFSAGDAPAAPGAEDGEEILDRDDVIEAGDSASGPEQPTLDAAGDDVIDLDEVVDPAETSHHAPEDNDEVMELTDIVQPEEIQPQGETAATDDKMPDFDGETVEEDILELTDIVQPEEIQPQVETAAMDEDMPAIDGKTAEENILELTDIVQPEEIQPQVETATADAETADFDGGAAEEDILELTDIIEPPEQAEETGDDAMSAAAETTGSDDPPREAAPEAETVEAPETASDTAELADLFMDEMTDPDEPLELAPEADRDISADVGAPLSDFAPGTDDEDQVIQLADVLNQGARPGFPPMEQVKLGAEEDIDARPISVEQEDTANRLGLDLEDEAALDRKILANVEQVIQEKYAGTIEALISQAVEKAVTREIEALKRTLSEDDDTMR